MPSADDMSDQENWSGGFYELVLFDVRLDPAVRSLWNAAGVRGCRARYEGIDVEPSAAALAEYGHLGEDKDLTPERRWAAVLTPRPGGVDYLPATD